MVAPQHKHRLLKTQLDREDEGEHLDTKTPAVDIIPQEKILRCLEGAARVVVDELDEVVELPMNVTHDGDRVFDLEDVGFVL